MKKNLLFSIVAITLAVATIFVGVLLIFKNIGDTTMTIGNGVGIVGDTVEIPVTIDKNHGIWGGQVIIDYDSNNFSFVSLLNGSVFEECEVNDAGGSVAFLLTQSQLKNTNENGVVVTLKFQIKSNAKKGSYNLAFNSSTNFCNSNEEMLELDYKNGIITIK